MLLNWALQAVNVDLRECCQQVKNYILFEIRPYFTKQRRETLFLSMKQFSYILLRSRCGQSQRASRRVYCEAWERVPLPIYFESHRLDRWIVWAFWLPRELAQELYFLGFLKQIGQSQKAEKWYTPASYSNDRNRCGFPLFVLNSHELNL